MEDPPCLENEEWKIIEGFEKYMISNQGRVWTKYYKRLMNCETTNGYSRVTIRRDKKQHHRLVHRIVGLHFVDNPETKKYINHKDENTFNNDWENLEWVSARENSIHSCKGNKFAVVKITPIIQYDRNGKEIAKFCSMTQAAKTTGTNLQGISKCCKGYLRTSGGFCWKFENVEECPEDAKRIDGFEKYYITKCGRVYNKNFRRFLKPQKYKNGYQYVKLKVEGNGTHANIGRLVAIAFLENPENKPLVVHKNGNRDDNRIENLKWATAKENSLNILGKRKLCPVIQYDLKGNYIAEFPSIKVAEDVTGVSAKGIQRVCKKHYGRKTTGGYQWEYAE